MCVSCVFSFYSAWPRDDFIFVSFTCMWMLDFVREHEIRGYLVRLSDLFWWSSVDAEMAGCTVVCACEQVGLCGIFYEI